MQFGGPIVATLLACSIAASAHQPYESSAFARFDRDRLEMTVTTSLDIAGQLVGEAVHDAKARESLRPQLLKAGAELYEVAAGGEPLKPERVFFASTGGEAVFSVIFPVGPAADLRFRAAYLNKLPQGYCGSIEVIDEAGNLLGRQPLLKKGERNDSVSIQRPVAVSDSFVALADAEAAEQPSSARAGSERDGVVSMRDLPMAGICAGMLWAGSAWRFRRRSRD